VLGISTGFCFFHQSLRSGASCVAELSVGLTETQGKGSGEFSRENLGPGTKWAAGVVWKENAGRILERNRPEHPQGPRVCWGNSEAISTRWPILHRGHKRRVSLGELSCCGSGEAAG